MAVELPALVVRVAGKGVDRRLATAPRGQHHRFGGPDPLVQTEQFRTLRIVVGRGHVQPGDRRIVSG